MSCELRNGALIHNEIPLGLVGQRDARTDPGVNEEPARQQQIERQPGHEAAITSGELRGEQWRRSEGIEAVGRKSLGAALLAPAFGFERVVEDVEQEDFVVAEERNPPKAVGWRGHHMGEHRRGGRPPIDVIAHRDQPFFAVESEAIAHDLRLNVEQLIEAAVHVSDRVDGSRPGVGDEARAGHDGVDSLIHDLGNGTAVHYVAGGLRSAPGGS